MIIAFELISNKHWTILHETFLCDILYSLVYGFQENSKHCEKQQNTLVWENESMMLKYTILIWLQPFVFLLFSNCVNHTSAKNSYLKSMFLLKIKRLNVRKIKMKINTNKMHAYTVHTTHIGKKYIIYMLFTHVYSL